jgi:hypothetical protein
MKYNKIKGIMKDKRIYSQLEEVFSLNLETIFLTK